MREDATRWRAQKTEPVLLMEFNRQRDEKPERFDHLVPATTMSNAEAVPEAAALADAPSDGATAIAWP